MRDPCICPLASIWRWRGKGNLKYTQELRNATVIPATIGYLQGQRTKSTYLQQESTKLCSPGDATLPVVPAVNCTNSIHGPQQFVGCRTLAPGPTRCRSMSLTRFSASYRTNVTTFRIEVHRVHPRVVL